MDQDAISAGEQFENINANDYDQTQHTCIMIYILR
jgi:hypothetical protein